MAGRAILTVILLGSAAAAGWHRSAPAASDEPTWEQVDRAERTIPISHLLRASRLPLQTASRQAAR